RSQPHRRDSQRGRTDEKRGQRDGSALHHRNQTGSNWEISQRPSTLSKLTLTLDAVLVGALGPTMTVWFTNTRTTACVGVADVDAAAGTVATAEICFCFAPGITRSWVNFV